MRKHGMHLHSAWSRLFVRNIEFKCVSWRLYFRHFPYHPPLILSFSLFSRAAVIRSCCTHIGILSRPGLGVVCAAPETSESIRNSCGQFDSWARHRGNLRNPYSNRCIACAITCMKDPEVVCTHGRNGQYYYCYAKRRHSSSARVNFPSCNWQITHRRKSSRVDVTNTGTQFEKEKEKKIASSFLINSLQQIYHSPWFCCELEM